MSMFAEKVNLVARRPIPELGIEEGDILGFERGADERFLLVRVVTPRLTDVMALLADGALEALSASGEPVAATPRRRARPVPRDGTARLQLVNPHAPRA